MKGFASFHPLILFFYFLSIVSILILSQSPVIIFIAYMSSLVLLMLSLSIKLFLKEWFFYFFVWLLIVLVMLYTNHKGQTILFFLNENPVTMEIVVYGASIGILIWSVAFWCKSYSAYISTEKVLYVCGKTVPKLAIWLALYLRFLPQYKRNIKNMQSAQRMLGFYATNSRFDRMVRFLTIAKCAFTLTIEQTFSQISLMAARGYGLKKRTYFSIYQFREKDAGMLIFIGSVVMFYILFFQQLRYVYFPTLMPIVDSIWLYAIIQLLYLTPALIEIKEIVRWKYLKSKM